MTHPADDSLRISITVDVEEDGLGCGRYPRTPPGLANVEELKQLEFVTREFGLPLTLLATWPVLKDPACRDLLRRWKETLGAEIGAHLHPWNTPPFDSEVPINPSIPTPPSLEKVREIRAAVEGAVGEAPHSFRMGRFAVSPELFDWVQQAGFRSDASVVPFHVTSGRSAEYAAKPDPYVLRPATDTASPLWELPLTTLPVFSALGRAVASLTKPLRHTWQGRLQRLFQHTGVAGVHPAWFSLPIMKQAVRLHQRRGGNWIQVFLHSSDFMPGCTPSVSTDQQVRQILGRLRAFLEWLLRRGPLTGVTLADAVPPDNPFLS